MVNGGTTSNALLGLLSIEPMSGYDMRQLISESIGYFWSESYGQIYPALKRMLADGLVEIMKDEDGEGHPAKKVYRLTEAGRLRLKEWLGIPVRPHKHRNEMLLKLFFGSPAESGVLVAQVESWRTRYASDLERYVELEKQIPERQKGHPGLPFFLMTLRYGIVEAKALVGWCDETLAELKKLDEAKGRLA